MSLHARLPLNNPVSTRWSPTLQLTFDEARARLAAYAHGVCCTVHQERGPDPVPVVYALDDGGFVGIPTTA